MKFFELSETPPDKHCFRMKSESKFFSDFKFGKKKHKETFCLLRVYLQKISVKSCRRVKKWKKRRHYLWCLDTSVSVFWHICCVFSGCGYTLIIQIENNNDYIWFALISYFKTSMLRQFHHLQALKAHNNDDFRWKFTLKFI